MPSYMFGQYLSTLVSVHFPGGRLGWAKAGCDACTVPVPGEKDLVYILIPEATTKDIDLSAFRTAIETACEQKRMRLRWVSTSLFEGRTMKEFKDEIAPAILCISLLGYEASIAIHPAVFVINSGESKEDADKILEVIGASGIIPRAVVVQSVGCFEREYEVKAKQEPPAEVSTVIESSTRDKVITKDEVIDLTILLENIQSVDEFIKSI